MRFRTSTAGGDWQAQPGLAQACEHANLTCIQAQAARLAGGSHSYRAIATSLRLSYPAARRATLAAARKLADAHPHKLAAQRRDLVTLFQCLRNRRSNRPPGVAVYAARDGGGWEADPVRLRVRAEGELVEDLLDCPFRFLRELARQLD